jgi:uncharacterized protein (UPF0216 family)
MEVLPMTMNKPTRFEIMRRNRPKVIKARKTMRQWIDHLEAEVTAPWGTEYERELRETAEALARDRERQLRTPWYRRLFVPATEILR